MKFCIIYEESARLDIREISRYYGIISTDLRRRFQSSFKRTTRMIVSNPMLGQTFVTRQDVLLNFRSLQIEDFEKFRIYYRVRNQDILIRRVLHGARDVASLLY